MGERLQSKIDHVAVAVSDAAVARRRWCDELGGGVVARGDEGVFRWEQIRFGNRGRLELLSPSPRAADETTFIRAFLRRFGTRIHHCTLKVDDLATALATLQGQGVEPVDVQMTSPSWQEMFLRPSVVGGMVVQIAMEVRGGQTGDAEADEEGEEDVEAPNEQARPDAPALLGPRLRHPDLQAARRLWTLLGADVTDHDGGLRCTWPRSRLEVVLSEGAPAGPVALRFSSGQPRGAEEGVGPRRRGRPAPSRGVT